MPVLEAVHITVGDEYIITAATVALVVMILVEGSGNIGSDIV